METLTQENQIVLRPISADELCALLERAERRGYEKALQDKEPWYINDVAKHYRKTRLTIDNWMKKGILPKRRNFGGWYKSEVIRALDGN